MRRFKAMPVFDRRDKKKTLMRKTSKLGNLVQKITICTALANAARVVFGLLNQRDLYLVIINLIAVLRCLKWFPFDFIRLPVKCLFVEFFINLR